MVKRPVEQSKNDQSLSIYSLARYILFNVAHKNAPCNNNNNNNDDVLFQTISIMSIENRCIDKNSIVNHYTKMQSTE